MFEEVEEDVNGNGAMERIGRRTQHFEEERR
jgi:hypothetical protein